MIYCTKIGKGRDYMDIAVEIDRILSSNPNGLKAAEIADQIGVPRKQVNQYLYAHLDLYSQHDGYIWRAKTAKLNETATTASKALGIATVQQTMGDSYVSTLTVTKNDQGLSVTSTNNQIICCDCRMFFSIHVPACPRCGCPMNCIAQYYYDNFQDTPPSPPLPPTKPRPKIKKQTEKEYREEISYELSQKCNVPFSICYEIEKLDRQAFDDAVARIKALHAQGFLNKFDKYDILTLATGDKSTFDKVLNRIKECKSRKDLPTITQFEWWFLWRSNDDEYSARISRLANEKMAREKRRAEEHAAEQAKLKAAAKEKFKSFCIRHNLSDAEIVRLTRERNDLMQKIEIFSTLEELYGKQLDFLSYYNLSSAELKKLFESMK